MVSNNETDKNYTYQIIVNKSKAEVPAINPAMKKAQTIRNIAFGCFGLLIVGIIIFIIVKHRKLKMDSFKEDDEELYEDDVNINDDSEFNYEEKIDKSDEELFRRVNKSQFKPIKDDTTIIKSIDEQINNKSNEEDNKEIMDNYFRNLDTKRKGKHF